jgi:hypothetical protein
MAVIDRESRKGAEPSPLGCLIGLGMIAALWMPWGRLSLTILDVRPSLTFRGSCTDPHRHELGEGRH